MATQQTEPALTAEELTIVDADSHLSVSAAEHLVDYIDESNAARDMIETAAESGMVYNEIYTVTRASPAFPNADAYSSSGAGHDSTDPEGKIGFMNEFDVDYSVLTPPGLLATVNHDRTADALARAYNDWLLDEWVDTDDRLFATLSVASQVPDRMPEEVDRMATEDQVVGVQLPAAGLVPPAGHRTYDPIYEAAEDNGLPIVMHSQDVQAASTFPVQRRWAETFSESHAFSFPVESMWHLISLVCNGVPEKFPDLEWVLQESGAEWLPWMMWRLDDHYLQCSQDFPMLTKRPSEYIRDQFYITTQPLGHTDDTQHMGWAMEMAGGGDTLLYSTDHPHPDFDPPSEVLTPAKAQLDDDQVRKLMGETAMDVFGI